MPIHCELFSCAIMIVVIVVFCNCSCNAIIVSSATNSFLQLHKWISRSNSSLEFEFKTNESNSLLVYLDDGGISDFFELKLTESGQLRLRYNLGGGAQVITLAHHRLHDNDWHKVILERNRELTTLQLPQFNLTQSKLTKGKDFQFGLIENNSDMFFGGVPMEFNNKVIALSLPSVVFEPKFTGEFRNIIYRDLDSLVPRRQDFRLINKKFWSNASIDECELSDICQHDGICITVSSNVSDGQSEAVCDCRNGNYEGLFCEKEKEPIEATFKGAEFISYDLSKTKADPITSTHDSMSFHFKTKHGNGLLFFIADDNDYLNVALKDDAIVLTMSLLNGKQEMIIKPKRIRFDDNQWHEIRVRRKIQELTAVVDGIYADHSHIAGKFNQLSLNKIFVAGSLNTRSLPGARIHSNFIGCMRQVEFHADNLKLSMLELGRDNKKLVTLIGRIDFKCSKDEPNEPITFTNPSSFLTLPAWKAKKNGSISFKFRTNEQNGLLLYNGCTKSNKKELIAIEILNGHLYVHLNFGLESQKLRGSKRRVDDGLWHEVNLNRYGYEGRVSVDNSQQSFLVPGKNTYLELSDQMYLGGYKPFFDVDSISPAVWTARLQQGFVGCIKDFYVNFNIIDLVQQSKKQDSVSIKSYCHNLPAQCAALPCRNGGICTEGWNRYTCDCSSTSFTGSNCMRDSLKFNFNESQYMQITNYGDSNNDIDKQISQTEQLVFRFKTGQASCFLLSVDSPNTTDKIEFTIVHSRIRLFIQSMDKHKELVAGKNLNDNEWHTIKFARFANNIKLQLDSYSPIRGALLETENTHNKHLFLRINRISIGTPALADEQQSRHQYQSIPRFGKINNFVGQMQQLVFNGRPLMELYKFSQNKCIWRNFACIRTTARVEDGQESTSSSAVSFVTQQSYVGLPTLNAYSMLSMNLMFRTRENNALILYNRGRKDDYLALELSQGHISYIISVGRETIHLRDTNAEKLNDYRWHSVSVMRYYGAHILLVDENLVTASSSDDKYLELEGILFVAGVQQDMYTNLPITINSRVGFEGCLANLQLGAEPITILDDSIVHSSAIRAGCRSEDEKCAENICENNGVCIQRWQKSLCNCDMTSYSGPTCSKESTSYEFGPNKGIIIFSFPDEKKPETSEDQIAFGFTTTRSNAILLHIASENSKDYLQIELVDGNIFVLFNVGSNDHVIEELSAKLNDNNYHIIRFNRLGSNASLQIDNFPVQYVHRFGQQLHIFNSQSEIQIGGKWNRQKTRIERPFFGIISGLVINGLRVLDFAVNGSAQITSRGEVQLIDSVYERQNADSYSYKMQQTPASSFPIISDDLVISGGGFNCVDDEDQCSPTPDSIDGSGDDDLITPVYVVTKKPPLTTPKTLKNNQDIKPCDDEDCLNGSGFGEIDNNSVSIANNSDLTKEITIVTMSPSLAVNHSVGKNSLLNLSTSNTDYEKNFNTNNNEIFYVTTTKSEYNEVQSVTFGPQNSYEKTPSETIQAELTTSMSTDTNTMRSKAITTPTSKTMTTTTTLTPTPISTELPPPFRPHKNLDFFTADYPKIIYNMPYYPAQQPPLSPFSTKAPTTRRKPERVTSELSEIIALIIGIVSGALIAIILIIILILKFKTQNTVAYKMRNCGGGTTIGDDSHAQNVLLLGGSNSGANMVGNGGFSSPYSTTTNNTRQQYHNMNAMVASGAPANQSTNKKRESKDVKEWYV